MGSGLLLDFVHLEPVTMPEHMLWKELRATHQSGHVLSIEFRGIGFGNSMIPAFVIQGPAGLRDSVSTVVKKT